MGSMPPRARRPDPAKVSAAFAAQQRALGRPDAAGSGDVDDLIGLLAAVRELPGTPPYDRDALAIVTRALVDRLAAVAPGRSVELRVPPYAAVQCVAGPRHTRGKPPAVVETDPLTWLDLATGRMTWDAAVANGAVRASGERSNLAPYLPLARPSPPD